MARGHQQGASVCLRSRTASATEAGTWLWGDDCYNHGRIVNYGWYDG
ncbi:hypothetical protein [Amycolatopsis sp. SB7-3]